MNVLSLFDGMSCGQIALNKLGIEDYTYYASEINSYALTVTNANYPNTIQLGDVRSLSTEDLPEVDLLLAGSPCQGFSYAGKQLNFQDERSILFFDFVRILNECRPKYFLLENVRMRKQYQDIISSYLGVEPIEINSSLVSAQLRKRLYWTNIPGIVQPQDKNICINDILDIPFNSNLIKISTTDQVNPSTKCNGQQPYMQDRVFHARGKTHSLTASFASRTNIGLNPPSTWRRITPSEAEKLQTVPLGYTNHVSNYQRFKMLGNGWTIDVISHILKDIDQLC